MIGPLWGELRLFRVQGSPRTTRNEKNFQDRPKIFFFKSHMTLKYLLIIDFPKFEPLTAAEMGLCGNLGPKCQNLFPLV